MIPADMEAGQGRNEWPSEQSEAQQPGREEVGARDRGEGSDGGWDGSGVQGERGQGGDDGPEEGGCSAKGRMR